MAEDKKPTFLNLEYVFCPEGVTLCEIQVYQGWAIDGKDFRSLPWLGKSSIF